MSGVFGNPWLYNSDAAFYPFKINQSLRFEDGDNPYLSKTLSGYGGTIFTFSCWVKLGNLSINRCLLQGYADGSNFAQILLYSQNYIGMYSATSGTARLFAYTQALQRDPTAWYNIVVKFNGTSGSEEFKIYVNGENQTLTTSTSLSAHQSNIGKNNAHYVGNNFNQSLDMDGYMAEVNFIDGTALDADSFGQTKSGVWIPKDTSGLTFGTNGFRLQFQDISALGDDTSGKGNDFSPSGLAATDVMLDSPTNNFCTLNPLFTNAGTTQTFAEGNLKFTADSNYALANGTFAMRSGKWYWETLIQTQNFSNVGITRGTNTAGNSYVGYDTNGNVFGFGYQSTYIYGASGDGTATGATLATGQTTYTTGDIIGCSFDADAGELKFYKNNSLIYTVSSINPHDWMPANSAYGTSNVNIVNFGQDSSFAGNKTSGSAGASDANGVGDFFYTPPSGGFLALCSANLPSPVVDPAANEEPADHFNTVLYTGNNSTNNITGVGFQPNWVWVKNRNGTQNHYLQDSVRGASNYLVSNNTGAENQYSGLGSSAFTSFDSDGFSVASDSSIGMVNSSSSTYVAWNWLAGGATPNKTYKVHVVSDGGNKYRFRDSADSTTFPQSAVELNLQEGGTYTFDLSNSSVDGHPMKFSTTSNGSHGGGTTYSTGVVYNLDGADVSETDYVNNFNSATSRTIAITVAASTPTLYYFCHYHSGMGGQINTNSTFGSTNFDGTILATVCENATTGISIIGWTGNGVDNTVVPHGLGANADVVITKRRSASSDWLVLHSAVATNTSNVLRLNSNAGTTNGSSTLSQGCPDEFTSVGFKVVRGTGSTMTNVNGSGSTYIAYAFKSSDGFSQFGSYIGNGSSDGPYVYTGFRVTWLMMKSISTGDWYIWDSVRDTDNGIRLYLRARLKNQEGGTSSGQQYFDFLSNGFKIIADSSAFSEGNSSGQEYVYFAFSEQPFKFSNAR